MNLTPIGEPAVAGVAHVKAPTGGLLRRVCGRHLLNMALLLALPLVFASSFNKTLSLLNDPDLWWHLADARLLTTTHHFIQTEPYSFTVANERWINPEWLSELPCWFAYRIFALRGIYLVAWLALYANILFVYWRGFFAARHPGAAFWAACLGFVLMAVNAGPRTILFGYLAMSAELLILEAANRGRKNLLWLLPPLFAVWINLHGTWLIGIALLALYILCGLFKVRLNALEQVAMPPADRNRMLVVFVASVAALMVNPYGWRLVWNPLDMIFNQKINIAAVSEWQPLKLGSMEGAGVLLAIALMVLASCIRGRRWTLFEMAVVFFAWFAAIDHVRFMFLAAVLTGPILAKDFARSFCSAPDEKTIPAMNALLAAGALCFVAFWIPSEAALQKTVESYFPLQTIRSIEPGWRTFNLDYVGGRMVFDGKSPFVDSRIDIFEHRGVFQDYLRAMSIIDPLAVLDRYHVDHVLVRDAQPLSYLLKRTPGWIEARRESSPEGDYVLFARAAQASAPVSAPKTQ